MSENPSPMWTSDMPRSRELRLGLQVRSYDAVPDQRKFSFCRKPTTQLVGNGRRLKHGINGKQGAFSILNTSFDFIHAHDEYCF